MNDKELIDLANETHDCGLNMSKTFTKTEVDRGYMVFAIYAALVGLSKNNPGATVEYNGEFFKSLRLEKKLTLRQVEDATGVSNSYLSQLESGKVNNPSQNVVNKLLDYYYNNVSIPKDNLYLATLKQTKP